MHQLVADGLLQCRPLLLEDLRPPDHRQRLGRGRHQQEVDALVAVVGLHHEVRTAHRREAVELRPQLGRWVFGCDDCQDSCPHSHDEEVDDYSGLPAEALTDMGSDPREVYVESLAMWFDVRARYLQWTDGRLAQMLIATDITARRHAEAQQQQQAEKAQVTSRLITMGEMASSVAHELNQPLTAISTYCAGMISRLQSGRLSPEDMLSALEKTAKQAQRAGQIIHRIRNFVKRSEPQRQGVAAQELVDDAVELASIELRRRNVQLQTYVAQHIPMLQADPIDRKSVV